MALVEGGDSLSKNPFGAALSPVAKSFPADLAGAARAGRIGTVCEWIESRFDGALSAPKNDLPFSSFLRSMEGIRAALE